MKFLTIAYLAGSATAGLINPPTRVLARDLATVSGVLSAVSSNLVALDTAAKAFSGSSADLDSATAALIQSIKDGKAKVDASADLSLVEAIGLQSPANDLQTKGGTFLDDLKAKKTQIQAAGICATVLQQIKDINTNSQALSASIVSKVPSAAQDIAQSLTAGLTNGLNSATTEFSPANCIDSASAPATSAPATSAPATSADPTSAADTSAAAISAAPTSIDSCGAPGSPATTAAVATTAPVELSSPTSVSVPPGYCPCPAS